MSSSERWLGVVVIVVVLFLFLFLFFVFFCLIDPHFKLCQTGEEQAKGVDLIDFGIVSRGICDICHVVFYFTNRGFWKREVGNFVFGGRHTKIPTPCLHFSPTIGYTFLDV